MNSKDLQDSILNAVEIIVQQSAKSLPYTMTKTGLVISTNGYKCIVKIAETEYECILTEHLQSWIEEGDIVLVQEINNTDKVIVGKTGTIKSNSFMIVDEDTGKGVSGIERIYDAETEELQNHDLQLE